MIKHTFQVGDLVTCHDVTSLCPDGTKALVVKLKTAYGGVQIWVESLDERFKLVNGYFMDSVAYEYLCHDTDFRVGDWVRYEGAHEIVPERWRDGTLSEIYEVSQDYEGDKMARISVDGKKINVYQDNLVKIQPPQEEKKMNEKKEQIDIVNRETGEVVRDVETFMSQHYSWKKVQNDRVVSFSIEHWKRYEEWVKIEVRKSQWETINTQIGTFEAWGLDGNYHTVSWRPVK